MVSAVELNNNGCRLDNSMAGFRDMAMYSADWSLGHGV